MVSRRYQLFSTLLLWIPFFFFGVTKLVEICRTTPSCVTCFNIETDIYIYKWREERKRMGMWDRQRAQPSSFIYKNNKREKREGGGSAKPTGGSIPRPKIWASREGRSVIPDPTSSYYMLRYYYHYYDDSSLVELWIRGERAH